MQREKGCVVVVVVCSCQKKEKKAQVCTEERVREIRTGLVGW